MKMINLVLSYYVINFLSSIKCLGIKTDRHKTQDRIIK